MGGGSPARRQPAGLDQGTGVALFAPVLLPTALQPVAGPVRRIDLAGLPEAGYTQTVPGAAGVSLAQA